MEELSQVLLDRISKVYPETDRERILQGFAVGRAATLRVNRLKSTAESVGEALKKAGISWSNPTWSRDAFILESGSEEAVRGLPAYANGEIYLQSLSSMLPPLILQAKAGESVLDMAAAPGGKTTQIASLTNGEAMITACERNAARAEKLRFNLKSQGVGKVTVLTMDARQLDDLFRFDRILLDAPCSGSGTCCTLPGSRNGQFTEATLAKCRKTQQEMLKKALVLLKPGHEMVYSTCSILPEENEEIVRRVISGKAEVVPIDSSGFSGLPLLPNRLPGTLTVAPDGFYEGFFVAKLRKNGK